MAGSEDDIPPPPPSQTPTQQTPHTVSTIKLPILKKGEYDIWAMKMEHYLAHTDYPIWEVIQRGNGPVSVSTDTNGLIKVLPPKTAEEILARERERKARTTLLMALPEREQLGDASIEIQAYTQALKKVEAQFVAFAHQQAKLCMRKRKRRIIKSEDEHVFLPTKEQETPSFAFISTVTHVKTPRQTVKVQNTYSQSPKPDKKDCSGLIDEKLGLGYGFTKKACFVCGSFSHLIRDYNFHEKRMAKQAELNNKMSKRSGQRKIRPDYPQRALQNKGIVDSGCSRHMTGNKAYLAEYQDFNGGLCCLLEERMCDKKNKVLFTDTECLVLSPEFKLPNENQAIRIRSVNLARGLLCTANMVFLYFNNQESQSKRIHSYKGSLPKILRNLVLQAGAAKASNDSEIPALEDSDEPSLQIGIFNHASYDDEGVRVTPKTSHLNAVKRIFRYLKGKPKLGLWYPRVSTFDLEAYSDSDYAGANLDRKSHNRRVVYFLEGTISWQCKKRQLCYFSTTEANMLLDAIVVASLDAYEKKLIQVLKIHTDDNVADLLTKAFDVNRESLERDIDGTEELLLPDLFILWLTKVSTDSAKLIPLGKDSTAIKTMAVLESCPKHNMVAYLEKTDGNIEFHEIISFLTRSSIHYALTAIFDAIQLIGFISVFLDTQLKNVPVPLDHFPINALTSKDEGDTLERQSEPQPIPSPPHLSEDQHKTQTDPSPRPSPTTHIPDSILEGSGGNHGGQSSSDRSLSGNEGGMTLQSVYDLCISLCTQVTDQAKEIKHLKAQIKSLRRIN
ncbi:hypothetical protein Tco_0032892 [Tanacetum coccineum]